MSAIGRSLRSARHSHRYTQTACTSRPLKRPERSSWHGHLGPRGGWVHTATHTFSTRPTESYLSLSLPTYGTRWLNLRGGVPCQRSLCAVLYLPSFLFYLPRAPPLIKPGSVWWYTAITLKSMQYRRVKRRPTDRLPSISSSRSPDGDQRGDVPPTTEATCGGVGRRGDRRAITSTICRQCTVNHRSDLWWWWCWSLRRP